MFAMKSPLPFQCCEFTGTELVSFAQQPGYPHALPLGSKSLQRNSDAEKFGPLHWVTRPRDEGMKYGKSGSVGVGVGVQARQPTKPGRTKEFRDVHVRDA